MGRRKKVINDGFEGKTKKEIVEEIKKEYSYIIGKESEWKKKHPNLSIPKYIQHIKWLLNEVEKND